MAWSLAYREVIGIMGGYALRVKEVHKHTQRTVEQLVKSTQAHSPIQIMAQKYMEQMGWTNGLGQGLLGVVGLSATQRFGKD